MGKDIMIPVEAQYPNPDDSDDDQRPSKSQKKRDMDALQQLGEALVMLPPDRLKSIAIPDDLRLAVRDAQRFTKHEARRRQMQYIGRLMRSTDPAPIQAALDEIRGVSAAANARQHRIEQLRTRLLEDERVLGEIAADHPSADLQQLRQMRRNALKEQADGRPPRAYRELFRFLRDLEATIPSDGGVEEGQ
jgi:ribosome-associated protein